MKFSFLGRWKRTDNSILQNIDYYDLDQKGAHPRQQLQGVSDGSWESEVTIGPEHNLIDADDPDAKVRIATVKIYRAGDSVSRYSVDVPLTSTMSTDGVPVGGVVAMPTSTFPSESFKKRYLFCDGSTFSTSKYPKLAKVLHGNRLPDMRGKFAEGSQSPSGAWTYHRAGLPNIKGMLRASNSPHDVFLADVISSYSGAFYTSSMGGKWGAPSDDNPSLWVNGDAHMPFNSPEFGYSWFGFDASKSSSMYGRSSTVQPESMTYNYYIKAK